MRGDRIKITNGSFTNDTDNKNLVFVYGVKLDENKQPIRTFDGSIQVESLGGVKCGTTGVIVGSPEKVHRMQLRDHEHPPGGSMNDFVELIPIMLDYYQQLGWFPSNNIQVVGGGVF